MPFEYATPLMRIVDPSPPTSSPLERSFSIGPQPLTAVVQLRSLT